MKLLRLFLTAFVAPCECVVTYTEGEVFKWRMVNGNKCRRRGHCSSAEILRMR